MYVCTPIKSIRTQRSPRDHLNQKLETEYDDCLFICSFFTFWSINSSSCSNGATPTVETKYFINLSCFSLTCNKNILIKTKALISSEYGHFAPLFCPYVSLTTQVSMPIYTPVPFCRRHEKKSSWAWNVMTKNIITKNVRFGAVSLLAVVFVWSRTTTTHITKTECRVLRPRPQNVNLTFYYKQTSLNRHNFNKLGRQRHTQRTSNCMYRLFIAHSVSYL